MKSPISLVQKMLCIKATSAVFLNMQKFKRRTLLQAPLQARSLAVLWLPGIEFSESGLPASGVCPRVLWQCVAALC